VKMEVDWQIFQKIPGYFRITWVNPDTKMTPKTKKNILVKRKLDVAKIPRKIK
jgi:hypothetical protein